MPYFSIFFKEFYKPCINLCAFGLKTQYLGNYERVSKIFKRFLKKIAKNALF